MVKKVLLGLLLTNITNAEISTGHYEIITDMSKTFLKAKNDFLELNKTFKTCIEEEENSANIRIQSTFLGRITTLEQQFYDYFEKDFKSTDDLRALLTNIQVLEHESLRIIPCVNKRNSKAFKELEQSIKQTIQLEHKMDNFLDNTKKSSH
ncbi:hypothetical protein [Helicobacter cetorum]|uniref:Uncharacterized protein n=2 Tax=Helicobacter cetorum TaxID=138563 RepID=I0ELE0_HELC0|nr:hypothetical protein [Helicobacter cetorum]AFI03759.1 hypothetical protein HCW_02390 [Helicobacter cetorum MIT 00-7128]